MLKHIPFTVLALTAGAVVALLILLIGGALAGWNLWRIVTSPMAYFIYTVLVIAVVTVVFKYFCDNEVK